MVFKNHREHQQSSLKNGYQWMVLNRLVAGSERMWMAQTPLLEKVYPVSWTTGSKANSTWPTGILHRRPGPEVGLQHRCTLWAAELVLLLKGSDHRALWIWSGHSLHWFILCTSSYLFWMDQVNQGQVYCVGIFVISCFFGNSKNSLDFVRRYHKLLKKIVCHISEHFKSMKSKMASKMAAEH